MHIHWKILMQFYVDISHSLSTPMIMRSLDINDDSVWSQKKDESFLVMKLYLGVIRALVHLTNNIIPDICFAVNLLARFIFSPIKGHWNGVLSTWLNILEEPYLWVYSIPRNPRQNWLITQMQNIYLIRIKLYLNHAMCIHVEAQ